MKINEVEQLLGISKTNIRFYEKEGLIAPERSENGYRNYTQKDVDQLKDIIILRKLGIPVQQIQDILDGSITLQDAIDINIASLKEEIEKLNGSLALCHQLKQEKACKLDTQRYWEAIQEKEEQGYQFLSLVHDYWQFIRPITEWLFWYIPEDGWKKPRIFLKYVLIACAIFAGIDTVISGENFLLDFIQEMGQRVMNFLIWAIALIPAYLLMKKNKAKGENFRMYTVIAMIVLVFVLLVAGLTRVIVT